MRSASFVQCEANSATKFESCNCNASIFNKFHQVARLTFIRARGIPLSLSFQRKKMVESLQNLSKWISWGHVWPNRCKDVQCQVALFLTYIASYITGIRSLLWSCQLIQILSISGGLISVFDTCKWEEHDHCFEIKRSEPNNQISQHLIYKMSAIKFDTLTYQSQNLVGIVVSNQKSNAKFFAKRHIRKQGAMEI